MEGKRSWQEETVRGFSVGADGFSSDEDDGAPPSSSPTPGAVPTGVSIRKARSSDLMPSLLSLFEPIEAA